jgi:hemolysin III
MRRPRSAELARGSRRIWLIAAGGMLYSTGVVFHLSERLRFQNAIWHCFVLMGALCHYTAVLEGVALAKI